MTADAYEVAANWWADRLSHIGVQDNGDGLQSLLATYVAHKAGATLTEDERRLFVVALAEGLAKHGEWSCGVDYGPDVVLSHALEVAVPDDARRRKIANVWPIKTWMSFDRDKGTVKAAHGYGADLVQIYPLTDPIQV